MATTMATTRQPFAPLNGSRLQNLTSLKNRQNALSSTLSPPSKRKATAFEDDNTENIDPIIFLSPKRSKCPNGSSKDTTSTIPSKPTNFFLTRAPPSPNDFSSLKPHQTQAQQHTSPRRSILQTRSPRLDTSISKSTPLSAPAGRSPTRKRIGILNRRRTSAPFTRIDPPKFSSSNNNGGNGLGFNIDAALAGTIPSYSSRQASSSSSKPTSASTSTSTARLGGEAGIEAIPILHTDTPRESWFFSIHEDTEEELATNLMEHSTCTLDISSDEESRVREKDCRGKENVPPLDDVSQTRTSTSTSQLEGRAGGSGVRGGGAEGEMEMEMEEVKARVKASRRRKEEGEIEVDRSPLGDLAAEDFYAEGCDEGSVVLVPGEGESYEPEPEFDEAQSNESEYTQENPEVTTPFNFTPVLKGKGKDLDIETLMSRDSLHAAPKAALLQPIEKAEEGFELWESGSAKDGE